MRPISTKVIAVVRAVADMGRADYMAVKEAITQHSACNVGIYLHRAMNHGFLEAEKLPKRNIYRVTDKGRELIGQPVSGVYATGIAPLPPEPPAPRRIASVWQLGTQ